ncbi:50S ribosomal L24 [Chlorella sorokiniana]|jgi:large subunit ribosomal protein L24|uniref:50S ribosomal L24 n=1 Tax=Chlorella sorokiniana TaxID=3076 RepID=A0A2P6TBN1_CHLSO|nr:50S ribosomal L24 [Chlorella sorokiniana]|eukprot:PRW18298.1 50S ribosomal L24 [Chlorella sorokiniana]
MGVFRRGFQAMFGRNKWKILRGDKVMVMAGRDAGQVGTVTKVIRDPRFPRVLVEGLNLNKRFLKRTKDNPGGIVSVESPLHYSNVSLVDPVTEQAVRVTWRFLEDGTKVRVTKGRNASGSVVPRPEVLKQRRKPRTTSTGPKDTAVADAAEVTHKPGDLPSALEQLAPLLRMPHVHEAAGAAAGAAAQQQRQYHAAAAAAVLGGGFASSPIAAAAARLLGGGGRLQPLSRQGGSWRGFAASLW